MSLSRKNLAILIFFAAGLGILWYIGYRQLDPDFGWHLRMGQIISTKGIAQHDPFSYTMPSYHFVDHEWLTNLAIAKIYPFLGKAALALISSLVVILSLFLRIPKEQPRFIILPLALSTISLISFSGVRPQVLSWLFFAVLLLIIENAAKWKKWSLFLPLLFLAWANFHGGFAIGLGVIFIFIAAKTYEKRKLEGRYVLIFLLSLLATLLNPYGLGLWKEVLTTTSDFSLKFRIVEWQPAFLDLDAAMWLLISLSISLIVVYRKEFTRFQVLVYFGLFLAGLTSVKYIPFWIIFSLPMIIVSLARLGQRASRNRVSSWRFNFSYKILLAIGAAAALLQLVFIWKDTSNLSETKFYPKDAVAYLQKNHPVGEIFSEYGWGGYLIWKLPTKKVFIDGRMPSWKLNNPTSKESASAFKDYLAIETGDLKFKGVSQKYNITTVLWSVPKKGEKDNSPPFINQVSALGWREIYKDSVAVIYQKPR